MALIKGAITFGSNFNIGAKGPIDARMRVEFKSDLTSVWSTEIPAFKGMFVSVLEDASLYILIADDATSIENWKKVGADSTLTVDKYSEAEGKAGAGNLGQIIYVKSEEVIEDESGSTITYTAGPYIVTGERSIAKLGTTTATGDIEGDVNKLKGDVSTIQVNVSTLQSDMKSAKERLDVLESDTTHIIGGDDIE